MSTGPTVGLLATVEQWLAVDPAVEGAVLYGSCARGNETHSTSDGWSDVDLHIISGAVREIYSRDWKHELRAQGFFFQTSRRATGGTNKLTLLCKSGQVDLVVLGRRTMRFARMAMRLGLQRRVAPVRNALNEMATSMRPGYRFLKGAGIWEKFYARVVAEMPGVRLDDQAIRHLADSFLTSLLLAFGRLERGELMATQVVLHSVLAETNFRMMRELRLRRGQALPSFGLARRAEILWAPAEQEWVRVSARLDREELSKALGSAFDGMRTLMAELVPAWNVPAEFMSMLTSRCGRHESRA